MKNLRSMALTLGLAVLLLIHTGSARDTRAALSDDAATLEASEKYNAAQAIGQIRKNVGLSALSQDPNLDEAADNHSTYMEKAALVTFEELPGDALYTGGYPSDRAHYAGYSSPFVMEYDNFRMVSYADFLDWSLKDPYLRTSLLSPQYSGIGFGRSGYYYCMMLGGSGYEGNSLITAYPYAGQEEVPGVELVDLSHVPEGIEGTAGTSVGLPVTIQYYAPQAQDLRFEQIEAQILDSERGKELEFITIAPQDEDGIWNTLILFPTHNYTSSTRYTVSVSFDVYDGDTLLEKIKEKWSFTSVGPDFMGGVRRDTVLKDLMLALSAPQELIDERVAALSEPDSYTTREQAVVWMIDLLNECVPEVMSTITVDYKETYEDINQCEEEARDKVQMAYQMRLIEDQGRGILNPKALMSRAELERILNRLQTRFTPHWTEEEQEPVISNESSSGEESAPPEAPPEDHEAPEGEPSQEPQEEEALPESESEPIEPKPEESSSEPQEESSDEEDISEPESSEEEDK